MQIFWTILSGVLVFLIGQAALKFYFEPLQEFRRTVAEIAHALIEYASVYGNPGFLKKDEKKVSAHLKNLSSKLYANMYLIPFYARTARYIRFPSEESVSEAATHLIGLCNNLTASASGNAEQSNPARANKIRKALGIYIPVGERDEA